MGLFCCLICSSPADYFLVFALFVDVVCLGFRLFAVVYLMNCLFCGILVLRFGLFLVGWFGWFACWVGGLFLRVCFAIFILNVYVS